MDLLPSQMDSSSRMELHGFTRVVLKVLTPIWMRYVPDCVPPRPPLVCVTCESASKEVVNSGGESQKFKACRVFACGGQPVRNFCSRQWFSRQPRTT